MGCDDGLIEGRLGRQQQNPLPIEPGQQGREIAGFEENVQADLDMGGIRRGFDFKGEEIEGVTPPTELLPGCRKNP